MYDIYVCILYLSIYLSTVPSLYIYTILCLSIYVSVYHFICIYLSICLSRYLLSVCLYVSIRITSVYFITTPTANATHTHTHTLTPPNGVTSLDIISFCSGLKHGHDTRRNNTHQLHHLPQCFAAHQNQQRPLERQTHIIPNTPSTSTRSNRLTTTTTPHSYISSQNTTNINNTRPLHCMITLRLLLSYS